MSKAKEEIIAEETVVEDPRLKPVTIIIPLVSPNDAEYWVQCNNYSAQIMRGEPVEVPAYVAEFINQQMQAEAKVIRKEAALAGRSAQ